MGGLPFESMEIHVGGKECRHDIIKSSRQNTQLNRMLIKAGGYRAWNDLDAETQVVINHARISDKVSSMAEGKKSQKDYLPHFTKIATTAAKNIGAGSTHVPRSILSPLFHAEDLWSSWMTKVSDPITTTDKKKRIGAIRICMELGKRQIDEQGGRQSFFTWGQFNRLMQW